MFSGYKEAFVLKNFDETSRDPVTRRDEWIREVRVERQETADG